MWLLPTDGRERKQTVTTTQGQKRMRTSIELEFKLLASLPNPVNTSPAVIATPPNTLVCLPNAAPPSKLINSSPCNERCKRKQKIVQQQYRARQQAALLALSRENETMRTHIQELSGYADFLHVYLGADNDPVGLVSAQGRAQMVVTQFFHMFRHGFAMHSDVACDLKERFLQQVTAPGNAETLPQQLKRFSSCHSNFEMRAPGAAS
jgi:hypothetical protein